MSTGITWWRGLIITIMLLSSGHQAASQPQPIPDPDIAQSSSRDAIVTFLPEFFQRYQPNTALEMVLQVPGFTLDNGGGERGFGGAAGNVLINDRRPGSKQDTPSAILGRISSSQVLRLELIRVAVRDIKLQGHSAVVNVVLREDAPSTIRWEILDRLSLDTGSSPGSSISLADRWRDIEYNIAADARYSQFADPGTIERFDSSGLLTEIRTDDDIGQGYDANGYINASTWLGQTFFQVNTRVGSENRDYKLFSVRTPQAPVSASRMEVVKTKRRNKRLELGIDGERVLHDTLLGKALFIYNRLDQLPSASQEDINTAGVLTRYQLQRDDVKNSEMILRTQFDWAGMKDHALRLDIERAVNVLDNQQVFTDDTGSGPVIIDIPDANTRVKEVRWNLQAQDTWKLGDFVLDIGLGWERSTISQTGDSVQERAFTFLKPRAVLAYSPTRVQQTRLQLERNVSQLDFNDFVSAAVFEDNDFALGNPDLHPDSTWASELSHERRFGDVGVVKVTAFHDWITDVMDLLPLTADFETPGNIGDGRRWGLIVETTLPLAWTGLNGAQITLKGRLQDSSVTDPVTGNERALSSEGGFKGDMLFRNENRYAYDIDFRQDREAMRLSWGVGIAARANRSLYKVNELDIFDEGIDLSGFIETTRWFGLNLRIDGQNLLNTLNTRVRTIYAGERSLTPVLRHEFRNGKNSARVNFIVSGSF